MQIDHNPNQPSRRALKIIGMLTVVIVLAIMIPVSTGIRWSANQLPTQVLGALGISALMLGIGFHFGRWDVRNALGLTRSSPRRRYPSVPVMWLLGMLILISPFAVVLLPIAAWQKARDDGDGLYLRAISVITGLVFGLAISLASLMVIVIPVTIVLGH